VAGGFAAAAAFRLDRPPCSETWGLPANQFLSNHSREFKRVYKTLPGNLNFMDNVQIGRGEGWRD
jgi:hypothetical protein